MQVSEKIVLREKERKKRQVSGTEETEEKTEHSYIIQEEWIWETSHLS